MNTTEKQYVVVAGGDGFESRVVTESELEAAVHDVFCSCNERKNCFGADYVRDMRQSEWETNYHFGPVVFRYANLEDGWVSIILLTKQVLLPERMPCTAVSDRSK